jgi:hypothetical protein
MKKILLLSLVTTTIVCMDNPQTPPPIITTLPSTIGPIVWVKFVPNGTRLVTMGGEPEIQIWNTEDYSQQPSEIDTKVIYQSSFGMSTDGTQLAQGFCLGKKAKQHIQLIDLVAGKITKKLSITKDFQGTDGLAYSIDDKSFLSAHGNGDCNLWDLATDKIAKIFKLKDSKTACDVQINPVKPEHFATAYENTNIVAIWDVRNEKAPVITVTEQVPCNALAYNDQGLLAVGGQYNMYIHDQKMELLAQYDLQGNKMAPGQYPLAQVISNYAPWMPNSITFMPTNYNVLLAAIDTNNIIAYNLTDQSQTQMFATQDTVAPQSVDVHPSGLTMAVGGWLPSQTYIYDSSALNGLKAHVKKEELTGKAVLLNNMKAAGTSGPKKGGWNCKVS